MTNITESSNQQFNLKIKEINGELNECISVVESDGIYTHIFKPFKSKYVHKHDYPLLNRIDGEIRHYEQPSNKVLLPSVTTILSGTESEKKKNGLREWRKRVGEKAATEIVTYAQNVGTLMHENLENYVDGKPFHSGNMPIRKQAREMAEVIIDSCHDNVDAIWGQEVMLFYQGLWAGTTDLVGTYKGVPSIMDYKNSRQHIKVGSDKTVTFKLQAAAYALAHEDMFGESIDQAVFMCCIRKDPKNLVYEEFIFKGEEFKEAKREWILKVEQYHTQIGNF